MMAHEKALDTVLEKHFNAKKLVKKRGGKRLDFLCLADSAHAVVVEVKRPGLKVGVDELRQLEDYLIYLREKNEESSTDRAVLSKITGVLVYGSMDSAGRKLADRMRVSGDALIVTWDGLLTTAKRLHREYFDLMVSRAPSEDPRIAALHHLDDEGSGEAVSDDSATENLDVETGDNG